MQKKYKYKEIQIQRNTNTKKGEVSNMKSLTIIIKIRREKCIKKRVYMGLKRIF